MYIHYVYMIYTYIYIYISSNNGKSLSGQAGREGPGVLPEGPALSPLNKQIIQPSVNYN